MVESLIIVHAAAILITISVLTTEERTLRRTATSFHMWAELNKICRFNHCWCLLHYFLVFVFVRNAQ